MNLEIGRFDASSVGPSAARARWQPSRTQLRARLVAGLILLDLLCIFGGFMTAGLLYGPAKEGNHWLEIAAIILPLYLVTAINGHAYAAGVIQEPFRGVSRALQALVVAAGAVILIAFYLKASDSFSRATIAIGFMASVVLLGIARDMFLRKARKIVGGNPFSIVVIGDAGAVANGSIVLAESNFDPDDHCPMMYDRLATSLKDADRVVVACSAERRMSWARALKGANIQSEIIVPELLSLAPLGLGEWNGTPTLVVADGPLGKVDSFIKRAFDICVSGAALLALLALFVAVAVAIKLESRGPVFFVQTRIGRGNKMFRMLKFRSMRVEQCDGDGNTSTMRDDDRITRVGRFIRKTSIDELPQLVNVLLGDMSIVGPRPHAIGSKAENKLFWEIDERYFHRHAAKPGLTGLAQIRGFRGATMVQADLTNRLQSDLEYLNHWSIWKDIRIILLTFKVLIHKNAF
ncbi:exopolysaccharide biosynthesis polyprenyl glycosylphosphotransferase [Sphingosinithalassobacter sp. CS137]|uniref:exopolysaccharide biosynthesis polyprenyl glycosylphosphotransferase n=1 Tax=Sphingosinithalassobacter sp. CS137 TaxID=2762748 RepID=UPI00165E0F84|nr:exopolysaccharide biosynthesis polyprenyl glycosylphosphotransferase [Sphingosinithalassobacter sp. CS137]